ncbi:hypothetical protein ACQPU1_06480 [Clostridium paraputrificum]|uniref:hypothetical protein n=1 Tax=Clostridium paraputrificum TaxID=29363 RepID=UPI003D3571BC
MTREKVVDIGKRYSREIEEIRYILRNLENGRYYENSGAKMDGYLSTNIANIKKCLGDLINKVEYNLDSDNERIEKELKDI